MNKEMKDWLLEIIADSWNENDLAEWANEFLSYHYQDEIENMFFDDSAQDQELRISELKPLIKKYKHNYTLPELPEEPDGSLHNIGFIYDEDKDDRVLIAINQFKDNKNIIALAEHEGIVRIYSKLPNGLLGISVYNDEWSVSEYVPYRGEWIEVDSKFKNECIIQVLSQE